MLKIRPRLLRDTLCCCFLWRSAPKVCSFHSFPQHSLNTDSTLVLVLMRLSSTTDQLSTVRSATSLAELRAACALRVGGPAQVAELSYSDIDGDAVSLFEDADLHHAAQLATQWKWTTLNLYVRGGAGPGSYVDEAPSR